MAVKRAAHTSLIEIAIHFWRSRVSSGKLLCHDHNGAYGNVGLNHLWWTNAINNTLRVTSEERLLSGSTEGSRKNVLCWPGKKFVE